MDKTLLRAAQYSRVRAGSHRSSVYMKNGEKFDCPVPVEQRDAQTFNNKANGWPKSDISVLLQSSSDLELNLLLSKLSAPWKSKETSNLTIEQKFLACKPRVIDTPSERERFYNYCLNQAGLSEQDLFDAANEAEKNKEPVKSEVNND